MKNIISFFIYAFLNEEQAILRYMRTNPNFREDPAYAGKRFYFSASGMPLGVFSSNGWGVWYWVFIDQGTGMDKIATLRDLKSLTCKNHKR